MHYVGVDVSSATLEVAEAGEARTWTLANTVAGGTAIACRTVIQRNPDRIGTT